MGKSRHISAYALAGIPAVIGVAFVARFAYVTSDTAIDGAANAFMFGMIAAGAFAGPAIALAVAGNGRKGAACALGILALLAAIMNWSHTLGAIAHRGAGQAAQSAKASADQADARAELVRITAERSGMTFTPTTKETVDAARAAVAAAERVRSVECEERRNRCRERETQEQAKRDALTMILQAKAATDQAAQLDAEAAAIRARLAVAAPVRETNPLGAALGRLLAVSAVTAATWQQAIVSGIAELLIAAALALPELLRQGRPEARQESEAVPEVSAPRQTAEPAQESARRQRVIGGVALLELPKPGAVGSVVEFMLACLPRKRGRDAPVTAIYARYVRWCAEHQPPLRPLEPASFAEQFKALCERAGVETDRRGGKVYCLDVALVA